MELLIPWLILAILVGVFAERRGRFGFGYFMLAMVLSPLIGFLIVVLLGEDRAEVEYRQLASGAMRRCPDCAELVRKEARKCRHCGADLPAATA